MLVSSLKILASVAYIIYKREDHIIFSHGGISKQNHENIWQKISCNFEVYPQFKKY